MLVHAGTTKSEQKEIHDILAELPLEFVVDVVDDLESLALGAMQHRGEDRVALICVSFKDQLHQLINMRDLLSDFILVLILPDLDRETLSIARRLNPRYIAQTGQEITQVRAVLKHVLERQTASKQRFLN
jgi:hypothetical protein